MIFKNISCGCHYIENSISNPSVFLHCLANTFDQKSECMHFLPKDYANLSIFFLILFCFILFIYFFIYLFFFFFLTNNFSLLRKQKLDYLAFIDRLIYCEYILTLILEKFSCI